MNFSRPSSEHVTSGLAGSSTILSAAPGVHSSALNRAAMSSVIHFGSLAFAGLPLGAALVGLAVAVAAGFEVAAAVVGRDLGARDAVGVDALHDDVARLVELLTRDLVGSHEHRLEHHLGAALEVEAELRRPLPGAPRVGPEEKAEEHDGDAGQAGEDFEGAPLVRVQCHRVPSYWPCSGAGACSGAVACAGVTLMPIARRS